MKCSICEKEISGFGNNPWPVRIDEDKLCCNECNDMFVIPARIIGMNYPRENVDLFYGLIQKDNYETLYDLFVMRLKH